MDGNCEKHTFELSRARCRQCGGAYCLDCLVYSFGPTKPPFCVACALAVAGVRATAARPHVMSRREMRREAKAERKAARHQPATGAASDAPFGGDPFGEGAPVGAGRPAAPPLVHLEFTISDDGQIIRHDDARAS